MTHRLFEHLDVRLDVCDRHGTWFDRGELPAMTPWLRKLAGVSNLDGDAYQQAAWAAEALRTAGET